MNDHYLEPEQDKATKEESNDAKVRAAIKKYSRQTKIYPLTEWWDWDTV